MSFTLLNIQAESVHLFGRTVTSTQLLAGLGAVSLIVSMCRVWKEPLVGKLRGLTRSYGNWIIVPSFFSIGAGLLLIPAFSAAFKYADAGILALVAGLPLLRLVAVALLSQSEKPNSEPPTGR